ncbi:MAG: PHP domain-containing protein [Bacillota bacterium]
MNNLDVAAALYEIADLLELKGEDMFKIRAYRKAAEAVGLLPDEVEKLLRQRRLTSVPGIGKAIAAKIEELFTTGQIDYLEELRQAIPPGVRDLTRVPGLGARTAMLLYTQLGIDSLDRLELAARQGELRDSPGLGVKKEAAILAALQRMRRMGDRLSIGAVRPVAEALADHLRRHPAVVEAQVAGSIRRWQETVEDIDLVIASRDPEAVFAWLQGLSIAGEVLDSSPERLTMRTSLGRRIDVVAVPPERFGQALVRMTGSERHLAALGELPEAATEEDVYRALGLPWLPPELREGTGELEAARTGSLPRLITLADMQGDLHSHTRASDGTATLVEMAEAARALGHRYLAICDHSRSLAIAGGLTPERLLAQVAEIRKLNGRWSDFQLLAGSEVDILKDGSLDFPDEVLAQLDVVVASIHSHMGLDPEAQTQRLLRAIRNPHVDIIGHPTGRVLGRREPYPFDFEQILQTCAETGTALEISASPARLDLSADLARRARERGIPLAINTDAHTTRELELLEYGVSQARRAWLEPAHVINAMALPDLLQWLARPK